MPLRDKRLYIDLLLHQYHKKYIRQGSLFYSHLAQRAKGKENILLGINNTYFIENKDFHDLYRVLGFLLRKKGATREQEITKQKIAGGESNDI